MGRFLEVFRELRSRIFRGCILGVIWVAVVIWVTSRTSSRDSALGAFVRVLGFDVVGIYEIYCHNNYKVGSVCCAKNGLRIYFGAYKMDVLVRYELSIGGTVVIDEIPFGEGASCRVRRLDEYDYVYTSSPSGTASGIVSRDGKSRMFSEEPFQITDINRETHLLQVVDPEVSHLVLGYLGKGGS